MYTEGTTTTIRDLQQISSRQSKIGSCTYVVVVLILLVRREHIVRVVATEEEDAYQGFVA